MKKYTIIYQNGPTVGYSRVITDNLEQLLINNPAHPVWVIFVGWPRLEGEKND